MQLSGWHGLLQHRARRELPVADVREQFVSGLGAVLARELGELRTLEQRCGIEIEPPRFLVEQTPAKLDAARPLFGEEDVPNLATGARRRDERQPVAARLVPGLRD